MSTEEIVHDPRERPGWISLERLALIRVSGPQRVKFLHSLLSNDIAGLAPGQSRLAALMNLKGHQISWMRVMAEADRLTCELPLATRDAVVDMFIHYKVGAPVRFEKSASTAYGLFGPVSTDVLRDLGIENPPLEAETFAAATLSAGTLLVGRGRDVPAGGLVLHADPTASAVIEGRLRAALGEPMNALALDTLRIEEGIPWHGIDVKEENLLHETGQLDMYHSPSKGCYLGQEVVARLEGRGGNVNKKFRGFKSSEPMGAGDEVVADEKVVGQVTTAGRSAAFGAIAMGYVHRAHADPGSRVTIAGRAAEVVALPFRT